MPFARCLPVIDYKVRGMCAKPYPGHPHGCPNYNNPKRPDCPLGAPRFDDFYDMNGSFWVIYNEYDLGAHVAKMQAAHPNWTRRQLVNCLYWQPQARKALKNEIERFVDAMQDNHHNMLCITRTPEAMGVNITATMADIGVYLQWPPVDKTYQIAMAGYVLVKPEDL